jgi:hypothetical protein
MYLPQWVTAAVAVIQATTGPTNPIDALDNNHADNHGNNHPREVSFTATVPGRGFILALGADKAEEGQIVELYVSTYY